MSVLPIVLSVSGYVPQAPAVLRAELIAAVAATNIDYTANLPGSLIEDISSTDTFALVQCDSAFGELVNSITPYGANAFILNQIGQMLGVPLGQESNTSVFVVFTGPPGFLIAEGFTVSDGSHQYVVQDGGIIATSGMSQPLFCIATDPGSWAVPATTVDQLVTSVPSSITLACNNPQDGIPGGDAETEDSYRARVLQANLAASQGMARYLKTFLGNVPGVQPRLISPRQLVGGGWEIIVGGGDPYEVAYAIYTALFDISTLTGSVLTVAGVTKANPGVVTTNLNHGFSTGQVITITGALGMTAINNTPFTITVIDEKSFSIGINTTGLPTYTGGGVVSPNLRNVIVSINDYPDTYTIPIVVPPQQSVTMTVTWNTTSTNIVSDAAVSQLATPALVDYVNSIFAGQPMNQFVLDTKFQAAIASILPAPLLTRLIFQVSIDGIGVTPVSGTGIIAGDPESFFFTDETLITVLRG